MKNTNPTSHYLILVARKDKLKANRDAIVRTVAGMIEAAHFMQDPKNADAVAEIATVTGHNKEVNKAALKEFLASISGRPRMTASAQQDRGGRRLMKKIGAIKPDKEPVTYDKFVDPRLEKRQRDGEVSGTLSRASCKLDCVPREARGL